jgi:hypothetical protein
VLLVRGPEGSPLARISLVLDVPTPQTITNILSGLQTLEAHQVPHTKLAPIAFVIFELRVQKR